MVDAGGRAVIPGFVDSHTHLVFAGDRAEEFAARMAGERYAAGGIRTTVAATRVAGDEELRARLSALVHECRAQGTTTLEIKTGYGLDVVTERRLARLAAEVTDEVTFLGAHVVPPEYAGSADAYVALVEGEMLDAVAPSARWVDAFCEEGAFTAEQSRRVLEAGRAAGLGIRVHGNQLGRGRAYGSPSTSGPRRSTTAPISPTTTSPRSPHRTPWPRCFRAWSSRRGSRSPTHGGFSTPASPSPSPATAIPAPASRARCR